MHSGGDGLFWIAQHAFFLSGTQLDPRASPRHLEKPTLPSGSMVGQVGCVKSNLGNLMVLVTGSGLGGLYSLNWSNKSKTQDFV